MREISKLDKLLLLLGLLIVIGLFTLAFVIYFKGGMCAVDPCGYTQLNNISCYTQQIITNPYIINP